MIPLDDFFAVIRDAIPAFGQYPINAQQERCILAPADIPLMIIAGPGTGKTTVLVLRALRFVFVDGLLPENILITTFTRKAAGEIRSRLIEWGLSIIEYLTRYPPYSEDRALVRQAEMVDINRFITGTLDSICEDTLTVYRDPGDPPPVLVEGFVGNALLAREAMRPTGAFDNQILSDYLSRFRMRRRAGLNSGEARDVCRLIIDRLIQDDVDLSAFGASDNDSEARRYILDILHAYQVYMTRTNRMDFAGLESVFLNRLQRGRLQRFTSGITAVLIDEYQDTNPLQENIYFEVVRRTGASLTVVGDDDQSLYRFRGATVELFCDFANRLAAAIPSLPRVAVNYLVDNFRSTLEIVNFFNAFIECDPEFTNARVTPPKPRIVPRIIGNQIPILGMFRPDVADLARDLSSFLIDVFRGSGRVLSFNGDRVQIIGHPDGGDLGDAVLLGQTVNEFAAQYGTAPPRERLPLVLRRELRARGVDVFNPRGRALRDIQEVRVLLGLILECIDPPTNAAIEGVQQTAARLNADTRRYLSEWREDARAFIDNDPPPNEVNPLADFVGAWQTRINQIESGAAWPGEWPVLELCYELITWIPFFQYDPEGQVYLEAISRCIAQAATFSAYRSVIMHGNNTHADRSVLQAIYYIMRPLAENAIEVDEDIIPHVPRNRFPIMTVHQAKGLEFPLVIVDVASDFHGNHHTQRFRRFPEGPNTTENLEDDLAPYCAIGPLRTRRPALDRAFDDLIRLYYVAYSRPQSLLMLVGLDPCLRYGTTIKHVGTFWSRNQTWTWQAACSGRRPTVVNNHPLILM